MAVFSFRPFLILAVAVCCVLPLSASPLLHGSAVSIVTIPWGTARLDGGDPFVVPTTRVLEPGEYRLSVERDGFLSAERTIRVVDDSPQNHLIRLERR